VGVAAKLVAAQGVGAGRARVELEGEGQVRDGYFLEAEVG